MIHSHWSRYLHDDAVHSRIQWNRACRDMEHQLLRRVNISLPVRVHFRDGGYISGVAVNISCGGLFIQTSFSGWREGCADVRLKLPTADGDRSVRLPGFIVHCCADGMGLMFRELDAEAEAIVARLVQTADVPEAAPETEEWPEPLQQPHPVPTRLQ